MTTIACKDGIMAADMQETWEGGIKSKTHKLYRFKKGKWKGCVIGFCGASHLGNVIIDHLEDRRRRLPETMDLEMEGSAEAMIMTPDGIWTVNESCRPKKEIHGYYAIGSGSQGAFALMHGAGVTAQRAVEVICEVDTYTSGPVETMEVKQKVPLRKRIKNALSRRE